MLQLLFATAVLITSIAATEKTPGWPSDESLSSAQGHKDVQHRRRFPMKPNQAASHKIIPLLDDEQLLDQDIESEDEYGMYMMQT